MFHCSFIWKLYYYKNNARIGFSPVNYQASETDGSILFMFSVLEGNIAFDVNVNFETSDGSAQGMNDSGMHTHC